MENLLPMTPLQLTIALAVNVWMYVIFPVIIIRKINYLTEIMEAQYYKDQNQENSDPTS